jgi:hypothetical protein
MFKKFTRTSRRNAMLAKEVQVGDPFVSYRSMLPSGARLGV